MFDIASIVKGLTEGIVSPITAYLTKKQDVVLEKYRVDGQIDIASLSAEIQARKIDADYRARIASEKWVQRGRACLIGFNLTYFGLIYWDSCFRNIIPDFTWRILALPSNLEYIPYATVALLVGEATYNRFKR